MIRRSALLHPWCPIPEIEFRASGSGFLLSALPFGPEAANLNARLDDKEGREGDFDPREKPGTNPGTGTGYHPTALPTVGPYATPVSGFVYRNLQAALPSEPEIEF